MSDECKEEETNHTFPLHLIYKKREGEKREFIGLIKEAENAVRQETVSKK